MSQQPSLVLMLAVEDINKVLTGLMKMPYEQVVGLITNIQAQANNQLSPQSNNAEQAVSIAEDTAPVVPGGGEVSRSRASRAKY